MRRKHSKEELLEGALAASLDEGLSQLTFGRLAKRLDVSDRILVYYFPTKDDLVTEVLLAMGGELQDLLQAAFTTTAPDHTALLRAAWPVLATPSMDPLFGMLFEVNGLAAAGREPYRSLAPSLITAWVDWLMPFLEGTPEEQRLEAETALAVLDGLMLMRLLGGPAAANRAAGRLGIR